MQMKKKHLVFLIGGHKTATLNHWEIINDMK